MDRKSFKITDPFFMVEEFFRLKRGNLVKFIEDLDNNLKAKKGELHQLSDEYKNDFTSEEYEDWVDSVMGDDFYHIDDTLTSLSFNAALLVLVASFEYELEVIAKRTEKHFNSRVRIKDLKGNDIEQIRGYFLKVVEIDLLKLDSLWGEVQYIRYLRHKIAHNNAFLPREKKHEAFLRRIENDDRIYFHSDTRRMYLKDCTILIEFQGILNSFVDQILELVKDRLDKKRKVVE